MINFDLNFILAFFFGIIVLYILARLLYFPFKIFIRFLGSAVLGGIMLALFNLIGTIWGVQIGLNVITAAITGFMGVPGIILIFLLQRITS
ncbi:MAG: pro-sigmaK processing inhibitor BofA family protein [Bacillota bacterium]|nr:pro-sigmaK processing inhibitor BofA family protein [Bacillota bacterium]